MFLDVPGVLLELAEQILVIVVRFMIRVLVVKHAV